jgi:hypothetical protein
LDNEALVRRELEIENLVLNALSAARIPVTLCVWNYVPQLEEHQLVIATTLFDTIGPHAANARVLKALTDAGIYSAIPTRKLFVLSPNHPTVKALEREVKVKTEGSIHIMREPRSHPTMGEQYTLIFAPYVGSGGAVPARKVFGANELRRFLNSQVRVWPSITEDAIHRLETNTNASIPHVQLAHREAKRLGLA